MAHRHNTLTDEVFKNSKYIDMLQRHFEIKNFRKEDFKQYKILLDIFQTFILVNNCFYSDSNLSMADKCDNARGIIEKLIYNDYENSQKHKYSVRDIKGLLDKRARKLYNYMEQWQKDLSTITTKNATTSIEVKQMLKLIDKEMSELEAVGFDNIVNDDIEYKTRWLKNYKDYSIVISKFDTIYSKRDIFIKDFITKYYDEYEVNLTDDDIEELIPLFRLVSYANNGLAKVICNTTIHDFNINERSSAKYIYKAYLKSLNIDYKDIDTFEENSQIFKMALCVLCEEVNKKTPLTLYEVLDNFDMFSFMVTMEEIIENGVWCEYKDINKILTDLKQVYNIIDSIKEVDKTNIDMNMLIENYYIPAYKVVRAIIDRKQNCFVEAS